MILSAGALGSSEILLRSKEAGLSLSDRVGESFTGNGDVLGFSYNSDLPVNAVGYGSLPAASREPVGPCIAGIVDLREQPELEYGMVIEEGVIPSGIAGSPPCVPRPGAAGSRLLPAGRGLPHCEMYYCTIQSHRSTALPRTDCGTTISPANRDCERYSRPGVVVERKM